MEKLDFEIKLISNTTTNCPEVKVGIDHITYFAGEVLGEEVVKFTASVADNFNLHVKFAGNDPKKLILDDQGMPTNSIQITVDTIIIEGIDVTQIAYNKSEYNIDSREKYIDQYELTECMDLGLHGVWTMHIQSPVYIWMLENL
tara:strand:+ start:87 stop:518 length:432 start_codon:yes stop_codon:yes gene_type:complete